MKKGKINQSGFTLIEIILAMAMLAIVAMLMTPVLVSAYKQVAYVGDRSLVEKRLTGNAENVFAGGTPDSTAGAFEVTISTGGSPIFVNADKVTLESASQLGQPAINLYDPEELSFFNRPIDFNNVSVSTIGWNSSTKDGVYIDLGSLAAEYDGRIKYALYQVTGDVSVIAPTPFTGGAREIPLNDLESNINYYVEMFESLNTANKLRIYIPKAPSLLAVNGGGNKTYIKIDRDYDGNFEDIVSEDKIRYSTTINGSVISLDSSTISVAKNVSTARSYFFRFDASSFNANSRYSESFYVHPN